MHVQFGRTYFLKKALPSTLLCHLIPKGFPSWIKWSPLAVLPHSCDPIDFQWYASRLKGSMELCGLPFTKCSLKSDIDRLEHSVLFGYTQIRVMCGCACGLLNTAPSLFLTAFCCKYFLTSATFSLLLSLKSLLAVAFTFHHYLSFHSHSQYFLLLVDRSCCSCRTSTRWWRWWVASATVPSLGLKTHRPTSAWKPTRCSSCEQPLNLHWPISCLPDQH